MISVWGAPCGDTFPICSGFFFSTNENGVAVFSRLIATAAPKSQCQDLELGVAR